MTDNTDSHYQLRVPRSPMRVAPDHDAECSNECLYGERFVIASPETHNAHNTLHSEHATGSAVQHTHWLMVVAQRDSYTGYVEKNHLHPVAPDDGLPTHWVCSRSTLVFSKASIKSRVLYRLPFLSKVTARQTAESSFRALDTGGFLWDQHLMDIDKTLQLSPLQLAQSHFLGAPYLWGGCTPEGLDCSGLVQALAQAKGINIPRDSGDQEKALNQNVPDGAQKPQDIVYWPGHTGILVNAGTLLHATAHSLSCVIEPLNEVVERAGKVSSIKRLFSN